MDARDVLDEARHFDQFGLGGFDTHPGRIANPAEPGELVERDRARATGIRRVHHDQVEWVCRMAEREHALCAYIRADFPGTAEFGDVGAQRIERWLILFDEDARFRTARQRLQPEGARSGEQVGDGEVFETADAAGEHREQRLADAVGGRASRVAFGCHQRAAAPFSGDDSHSYVNPAISTFPGVGRGPVATVDVIVRFA